MLADVMTPAIAVPVCDKGKPVMRYCSALGLIGRMEDKKGSSGFPYLLSFSELLLL